MNLNLRYASRNGALSALTLTIVMVLTSFSPVPPVSKVVGSESNTTFASPPLQIHSSNSTSSWINMTSKYATAPSVREFGEMTYDAHDGYGLLQGGYGGAYLGDSWEYNYSKGGWAASSSVTAATARWGAMMSYDTHDSEALMYGGCAQTAGCPRNCYWYYSNGNWDAMGCIPPPPPPAQFPTTLMLGGMADDPPAGYAVMFGGCTAYGTGGCTGLYSDTWTFATGVWTQLTTATAPSARELFGMVWDPALGKVVLYGGYDGTKFLQDTWTFSGGAWTNITGTLSQSPGPRGAFGMTYDSLTRQIILFGGANSAGDLGDTWAFSGSGWSPVSPLKSPSARIGAMLSNQTGSDPVLFGGMSSSYRNDTWLYDGPLTATLTASPTSIDVGQNMTFTSGASGGIPAYSFSWSGLPSGCSGTTAIITCTPTASGTKNITVTITDALGLAVSTSIMYTVHSDPIVGLSVVPSTIWLTQSTTITASATGGSGGATYSWVDLPPACRSVPPTTSSFSCLPTKTGMYNVTVNVTDSNSFIGRSAVVTLTVKATVAPLIHSFLASPGIITLTEATAFSATVTGGTGSLHYSYAGLPPGCSTQNTTSLSCTPSAQGTFIVRFYANDSFSDSSNVTTALTVNPAPAISGLQFTPNPVIVGNTTYLNVTASGGTGGLTLTFTGLPTGCTSSNTTSLVCVPTVVGNFFRVRVFANDSTGASATSTVPLTVDSALVVSSIGASPNPVYVSQQTFINVTAAGGSGALAYAYAGLPQGCSSHNTVSLACVPTASGTFEIRVFVNDTAGNSVSAPTQLVVIPISVPIISTFAATPNPVVVNDHTFLNVSVSGGSGKLAYFFTGLPGGCASSDTGTLGCTPARTGSFNVRVFVNDSLSNSANATVLLVVISESSPTISNFGFSPNPITLGGNTTVHLTVAGGTGTLAYSYAGLPAGCSSSDKSSFSCTPTVTGTFSVRVFVNDSASHSVSSTTSLTVNANSPLHVTATANTSQVYVGGSVTFTSTVSGGLPGYSYLWSLNATNITVTTSTLNVSFAHPGNYTYRLWAKDAKGTVAGSAPLTIEVLAKKTTPPVTKGTTSSSGLGTSFGLLLLLIAAVIVAIVVAAVWWRRRSRPHQNAAAAETTAASPAVVETTVETPAEVGGPAKPDLPLGPPAQAEWDESDET
jgi:hypothetical protein